MATFTGDNNGYIPSHVGWRCFPDPSGSCSWASYNDRSDPVLDGQSGNHTNADWLWTPYSSFMTWGNSWLLESKRPCNWGILVAEGYVNNVKGVFYCPGRTYKSFYPPTSHPYPDGCLNVGSYTTEWKWNQPSDNKINLTKGSASSYFTYTYGRLDRIFRSSGSSWYAMDINPTERPLAWELNGYRQVDGWAGGPPTIVAGVGPTRNNHLPGITTLFFSGAARLVPDPGNVLESYQYGPGNGIIYDWLRTKLNLPHDTDFTAWKAIDNPGRGVVDNIDKYVPLYDAGTYVFPN